MVEHLLVGVIIGDLLLLFLNLLHQLLSLDHQDVVRNDHKSKKDSCAGSPTAYLRVVAGHDVRNTEVSQDHRAHVKNLQEDRNTHTHAGIKLHV